jgi:hypothetical protein
MVAQQLGVYESSQEATSEAKKYGLNEREVDTLRHILGAGLLKYSGKDSTQPLLQGTELFEKISTYAQRFLDPDSEDKYRKSYYDQSIEEANIDIVNYQVGAALAKQFDKKDDFINYAVELVKELGKGKTPVVVDKMPTRFGLVDRGLTPRLSTGVIYPPEELKNRNLIYNPDRGTLTAPPLEDYGFVEPAPGSNLEDQGPAVLEKAEGGSVEKKVKFVKEDDDDVPDPPPGATPEEVADDIPAYLSTGEYVLPANVVRYIGLKNITGMHQRALAELQQMEDLDIIENVDENGYVEEDDDEMDYMKPEGVVEIVVAEHHPKGLMVQDAPRGSGGIASLPRTAEILGQYHVLSYLTPEEQQMLHDAGGGLGLDGAQIYGPGGVPAFPEPGMGADNDHGEDSDVGDPGGGMSEFEEDLEPEEVEEEKPTDPYEGYTYVKGIGYVPTSRRATSIESASLSSIFTPGFLGTIGLMGDPNKEL